MSSYTIVILGGGAWGTAIATVLAHNNHTVLIWCLEPEVATSINQEHENKRYLPGIKLSQNISATTDLKTALAFSDLIFEATPVKYLREVLLLAKPFVLPTHQFVILSKGMEEKTFLLPTQIMQDTLGQNITTAVIAGPTFAHDLALKKISATVLASTSPDFLQKLYSLIKNDYFRPFASSDVTGTQVCATLKNILTLAVGIVQGAGYSENTIAFLVTRGLHEMQKLTIHCKGHNETAYGLSGIGDLLLTAFGTQSRNLRAGRLLGQGKTLLQVEQELGLLPEGINSAESIHYLSLQESINLPLCHGVYKVIHNQITPTNFIEQFTEQDT